MGLISDLHPLNLETEKTKFFQSNTYNPQLKYKRAFSYHELKKYGHPGQEFERYIQIMIARHQPVHFPSYPQMATKTFSDVVNSLCHQLQISTIPITFSPNQTARVMLTKKGLQVRTPIFLDLQTLEGLLNHEIQTHYLRRLSHQLLPVEVAKAQDPVQVKYTEEGLALLHTYLPKPQPFIKQFVTCYAQIIAQQSSFRTVFDELVKLGISREISFLIALKQKRGLEDTAQPGGFCKSHLYLVGAKSVYQAIKENPQTAKMLYMGKISLQYLNDNSQQLSNNHTNTFSPLFMANLSQYLRDIMHLGALNAFDQNFLIV